MALLSYGASRATTYKHNFDEDYRRLENSRKREERAMKEQAEMANMLTDDLEFTSAYSQYDNQELEKYVNGQLQKIGELVSNPDVFYNPQKRLELQALKRSVVDNDIVRRSKRFQEERERLMDWIKTNPDSKNDETVQQMMGRMNNYYKYGNADGEGLDEVKEFVFQDPLTFYKWDDDLKNTFGVIEADEIFAEQQGLVGETAEVIAQAKLRYAAENFAQTKGGMKARKHYAMKLSENDKEFLNEHKTLDEYLQHLGMPYLPGLGVSPGQQDAVEIAKAKAALNGSKNQTVDYYELAVQQANAGQPSLVTPSEAAEAFGKSVVVDNSSDVKVISPNGSFYPFDITEELDHFELHRMPVESSLIKKNGVFGHQSFVQINVDEAPDNTKFWNKDRWGSSFFKSFGNAQKTLSEAGQNAGIKIKSVTDKNGYIKYRYVFEIFEPLNPKDKAGINRARNRELGAGTHKQTNPNGAVNSLQ